MAAAPCHRRPFILPVMSDRFSELEAFVKAVEHRTLSAAARALGRSPSAMSKLINRLESRLGVRLINRTSREFSLTSEGETLYRQGQKVLDSLIEVEDSLSAGSSEISGVLRIGTSIQIAQYYLAPLIPRLREQHPRLEVHFLMKAAAFSLIEHQIDVAVFAGEQSSSSYVARRILPVNWIVCASPAYLARAGTPRTPLELTEHECLSFLPEAGVEWPFLMDGRRYSFSPKGSFRASSVQLLRTFALLGLGIIRIPIAQVRSELQQGTLVRLLDDFEHSDPDWLYAVYQSARHLSPRAVAFIRLLDSGFRADD